MLNHSNVAKQGAICLCTGNTTSLNSIAGLLFTANSNMQHAVAPRQAVDTSALAALWHVFLYNAVSRNIDPTIAAQKAMQATDIGLLCADNKQPTYLTNEVPCKSDAT